MALGALHSAPGSVAAVFTPSGGQPIDLRVVSSQESREASLRGGGRVIRDTNVVEIRRSDVAALRKGDALTIGRDNFRLSEGARLDVEGLTWICPLEPA